MCFLKHYIQFYVITVKATVDSFCDNIEVVKKTTFTVRHTAKAALNADYDITQDSVNQFIDGARTGKLENAAFTAVEATLTAIMAREAIYSGKEMTWDKNANA